MAAITLNEISKALDEFNREPWGYSLERLAKTYPELAHKKIKATVDQHGPWCNIVFKIGKYNHHATLRKPLSFRSYIDLMEKEIIPAYKRSKGTKAQKLLYKLKLKYVSLKAR